MQPVQVQYYLGTSYDQDDQPIKNVIKKLEKCCMAISKIFGGYTLSPKQSGGWVNNGKLIKDDTYIFTINTQEDEKKINQAREVLRKAFNQSSVGISVQELKRIEF